MVDDLPDPAGWTRARVIFLSLSGAAVTLLVVLVREVMLPFLLAGIIAYVLMPLVTFGQRRLRLARGASIVAVYTLVLGTLTLAILALAPLLFQETVRLVRESPQMVKQAAESYGPEIDRRVNAFLGQEMPKADAVRRGPGAVISPPALTIEPLAGGAYSVRVGSGVEIEEESPGHYRVAARESLPVGYFKFTELLSEGNQRLVKYIEVNAGGVLKIGQQMIQQAGRAVFGLFMVLMVAAYLMYTRESILGFVESLAPRVHRPGLRRLIMRMDKGLAGVVRGQLLICGVNGALSAVGFWLFDLRYWPVLALVATVLSIIPIFGAILSTIPAVFVGLTQGLPTALWVMLWIVGIHQLEANLLNPKIIGVAAKLHPVLIVFSLLVGEHFFGIWGALLAVPALSLVQSVFNHFRFTLPEASPDSLLPVAPAPAREL